VKGFDSAAGVVPFQAEDERGGQTSFEKGGSAALVGPPSDRAHLHACDSPARPLEAGIWASAIWRHMSIPAVALSAWGVVVS